MRLARRIGYWLRHRERDAALEEELEFHRAMSSRELEAGGLRPAAAQAAARRALGNVTRAREDARAVWIWPWLDGVWQDAGYAFRVLRRTPSFTAAAVVTLALGIGTSTAIFGVVNTVLLSPLPYDDPDGIYRLRTLDARGQPLGQVGRAHIDPLNERGASVQAAAYGLRQEASITGPDGLAHPMTEYLVSARFFEIFTNPLIAGRRFAAGDGPATVISHRLWRDVFGSDPGIVGAQILVGGGRRLVTGVAAPGFEFPSGIGAWTRARIVPGTASDVLTNMDGFVRLAPRATRAAFQSELAALARRLGPWPDGHALQFVAVPLLQDVVGSFEPTVLTLAGAAGLLLLVAGLNVTNLLLTRGAARAREMALRGALGAGRWRIARQLMTETVALCLLAGTLGVALAAIALRLAGAIGFGGLPRLDGVRIDWNVLWFATTCTLATMAAVGVVPALRQTRGRLAGPRRRLFGGVIVAEVAVAVTLVIGAGLLVRSYVRLASVDLGFRPDRLATMLVNVTGRTGDPGAEYLPVARFYQELMDRIRALPGVAGAAATSHAPLEAGLERVSGAPFLLPGEEFDPRAVRETQTLQVSSDYFDVMGISPIAGRLLRSTDRRDTPGVVLVNETFARAVYGARGAVGRTLVFPGAALWKPGGMAFGVGVMQTDRFEIVGVIPDVRQTTVWDAPQPTVYFPQEQWTVRRMTIVVRAATGDPRALIPAIRAELAAMDPTLPPVFSVYSELLAAALARQQLAAALLAAFGLASLVLAAVGVYALMSHAVSHRTRDIALRSALGASAGDVLRMIITSALRLALVGIAVGVAGAWMLRAVVASQLYEVSSVDPLVFAIVPLTMLGVSLVSSYLPARRAARIDPAVALRAE